MFSRVDLQVGQLLMHALGFLVKGLSGGAGQSRGCGTAARP